METVTVSASALRELLQAVMGPPHYILELKAIRSLGNSCIDTLIDQFNEQQRQHNFTKTEEAHNDS